MKMWSTVQDWIPRWSEVGKRIANEIEKNPAIQSSQTENINDLNMGEGSLENLGDMWIDDNGALPPVSFPFTPTASLAEEVKRVRSRRIRLEQTLTTV